MRTGGKYQFKTADELMKAAQCYFDWVDKNPIRGTRMVKTEDGEYVTRDAQYARPYTFEGLCDHIDISDWSQFVNQNKDRAGFARVIGRIRNKIRRNQIEGGMVGIFRENITARLNGIKENIATQDMPAPECLQDELDEE